LLLCTLRFAPFFLAQVSLGAGGDGLHGAMEREWRR
jgi:hypothetical protein